MQPLKLATSNLLYNSWAWGIAEKQLLSPKLAGSGLGEYPPKIGTPYLFMQQLKLATSNLVYNLGLGNCRETTFITKIGRGPGQGSTHKIWDPYLFMQQLKIATSNLVYKVGLGSSLPRNNFYYQYWRGYKLGEKGESKFAVWILFRKLLKGCQIQKACSCSVLLFANRPRVDKWT